MKKALFGIMACLTLSGFVLTGCGDLLDDALKTKVTGINISPSTLTLAVNATTVLVPTILPNDASDRTVTWQSVDPTIATVSDGVVTGLKAGSTTIYATTNDGGHRATCTVTVTANGGGISQSQVTITGIPAQYWGESAWIGIYPDGTTEENYLSAELLAQAEIQAIPSNGTALGNCVSLSGSAWSSTATTYVVLFSAGDDYGGYATAYFSGKKAEIAFSWLTKI
jgi:hypothetical protein